MRNNKGITIAALIIAIIGLSIGFAAFSNTLTIRSTATVNPNTSAMRVVFSLDDDSEDAGTTGSVEPTVATATYGDAGTITNSAPGTTGESLISGIHAKFTAPGQSVTYSTIANPSLYVFNAGSLQAQLTGITYNNVTSYSSYKKCTAVDYLNDNDDTNDHLQATAGLVADACEGISISVKVGNATTDPSNTSLNGQILNVGASLPVEITITYASGSAYADGPFEVTFGDIAITATSAVDSSAVVTPQQVDDLIPIDSERTATYDNEAGAYVFVSTDDVDVYYSEMGELKVLTIMAESEYYYWFCGSASALAASEMYNENILQNRWYVYDDNDERVLSSGPSVLSLESLDSADVRSESYLNRIIAVLTNSNG